MHREQKSKAACSAINFLKVQLIMQLKMILVNHRINRINETSQFSQFVYRCYCLAARHLKKFQNALKWKHLTSLSKAKSALALSQ